jgi:hypothetical protein
MIGANIEKMGVLREISPFNVEIQITNLFKELFDFIIRRDVSPEPLQ